jgi:hypothetical protein
MWKKMVVCLKGHTEQMLHAPYVERAQNIFRIHQQMHQFLPVYYFTLLLLHISANMCYPQGASLYLLSYMPIWVLVDKILCIMWLCVYYVTAWCVSICRSMPHQAAT